MAQPVPADVLAELAPGGTMTAAMNFGNPVLAQRDPKTGEARGVTAELARALAKRLGVKLEFLGFDTAGGVSDSVASGRWTVGFLAIDPSRAEQIAFTPPYVVIEGTYVVPAGSPLKTIEDVDGKGVRIAVGAKSAYDLYLSRAIRNAELVRYPSSEAGLDGFLADRLEAGAGIRQPVQQFADAHPGLRVMDGRFMVIRQAIALPKGRPAAHRFAHDFIEEMKASGFVAAALAGSGQGDAQVADPEPRRPD